MSEYPILKRGSVLEFELEIRDFDVVNNDKVGTPLNLTGKTLSSEVRTENLKLIDTLTVTVIDAVNGKIKLKSEKTDSYSYPPGIVITDVKITDGTNPPLYTDPIHFLVEQTYTK